MEAGEGVHALARLRQTGPIDQLEDVPPSSVALSPAPQQVGGVDLGPVLLYKGEEYLLG